MAQTKISSKSMDHLGLVAGMIDELGIADTIDNAIEQDFTQRNLSIGECVKAMIINGLGFVNYQLYLVSDFYKDKPIELLFKREIDHKWFNDDALGRALDKVYHEGVPYLFTKIASKACKKLGLVEQTLHLDSTSFHLHGKYEGNDMDENVIEVVQGYSRDFHPELGQVVLDLIVSNQAGIPLAMEPLSGNSSDKKDFPEIIKSYIKNMEYIDLEYLTFIADCALYTKENLGLFKDKMKFITRVPEVIREVKDLYSRIDLSDFTSIDDKNSFYEDESDYGEVKQRWVVINSIEARKKKTLTYRKNVTKILEKEKKDFEKFCKKTFACEADALQETKSFFDKCKYLKCGNITPVELKKHKDKGRPSVNSSIDISYQISAELYENKDRIEAEEKKLGFFTIATNHMHKYSAEEILNLYKDQGKVERGFRFLKDRTFLASSMFVEKPQRIEALLLIMCLCLMVYAALEYRIRKELKEQNLLYPNQVKKDVSNPTAKWVFQNFLGIHALYQGNQRTNILNVGPNHRKILRLLGQEYKWFYG